MSLVPFPAPSTAAPRGASGLARASATLPKASVTPIGGRGHAPGRADTTPATGRAASRFAHVLATAQEQHGTQASSAEGTHPGRASRVSELDTPEERLDDKDEASRVVPVPVEAGSAASVQTPWLLLALGNGAYSRAAGGEGESAEAASTECLAPGADQDVTSVAAAGVAAMAGGQPGVDASGMATAATTDTLAGVVGASTDVDVSGRTTGVEAATATQPGPEGPTFDVDVRDAASLEETIARAAAERMTPASEADARAEVTSASGAQRARDDGEGTSAAASATQEARPSNPIAGAVARWHVAARRSGGDVRVRGTAATATGEGAETSRTPGLAASRLAQALGAASGQEPSQTDGGAQATSAALPTIPTADVPLRSSIGSRREAHEPAVSTVSLGQALAATAPGSPPLSNPTPATSAAAPLAPAAGDQVLQQLVSSIKMQWKDGIGEAKLHLRPDALGAVSVSLRVEAGAVTAVVRAESAQVQEWVLQHQQTLRQQMEVAGLRLDDLVVSPDDQRQQPREESSPEPQHRRPRSSARADGRDEEPRFELLA